MLESGIVLATAREVADFGSPKVTSQFTQVDQATRSYNLDEHILYGGLGVLAGAADTLLESFGVLDENEMEDWMLKSAGEAGQYFNQNRETLGMLADIGLSFIPATLGIRAVRATGFLGRAATKAFGDKATPFLSTGLSNTQLAERFAAQSAAGIAQRMPATNLERIPAFLAGRRKVMFQSAKDVLIEGVAADAAIALTMNESEFLFPEDLTFMNHLAFLGGFNLIAGGFSFAGAKLAISKAVQREVGPLLEQSVNPKSVDLINAVQNVVGERHGAMSMYGYVANDMGEVGAKAASQGDAAAQEAIGALQTSYSNQVAKIAKQIAQDSPFPGITKASNFSDGGGEIRTIQRTSAKNPGNFDGAQTFDSFDTASMIQQRQGIDTAVTKLRGKVEKARDRIKILTEAAGRGSQKAQQTRAVRLKKVQDGLKKAQAQLTELQQLGHAVYELDGSVSMGRGRAAIFQDGERRFRREEGRVILESGNTEFRIGNNGTISLSATAGGRHVSDIDPDILGSVVDTMEGELSARTFRALGVKDEDELVQILNANLPTRLTGRDLGEIDTIKALRQHVKDTLGDEAPEVGHEFTMFGRREDDALVKPKPHGDFDTPVVVQVDEIVGFDKLGNVIRQAPRNRMQAMTAARFASLSHIDKTAVLDGLQAQAERHAEQQFRNFSVSVTPSDHWTKLDYIKAVKERFTGTDEAFNARVQGLADIGGIDALEFQALRSKFNDFQLMRREAAAHVDDFDPDPHVYESMENIAKALNLPASERVHSPILSFFEGIQRTDRGPLVDLGDLFGDLNEVKASIKQAFDALDDQFGDFAYSGSMMSLPRDGRPVLGLLRAEANMFNRGREDIIAANAIEYANLMERMRKTDNPLISMLMGEIDGNPELLAAAKRGAVELFEGARVSGPILDNITQQNFKARGLPGVTEFDAITELTDRPTRKYIEAFVNETERGNLRQSKTYQQALNKVLEDGHENDLKLWSNGVNSMRMGWDVVPNAVVEQTTGAAGRVFTLDLKGSDTNQRLWRKLFNEDMPENAKVPTLGTKKPVVFSDVAMDAFEATHAIDREMLRAENALLRAKGMAPVKYKPWHVPARDFHASERVFLVDHTNKVHQVVGGNTAQQARKLASDEIAFHAKQNGGKSNLRIVTDQTMREWHDSYARAYHEMDDYSKIIRKERDSGGGAQAGRIIETGRRFFQSMLEGQLRQFSDIGRRTRLSVMDPELRYLRVQEAGASITHKGDNAYSLAIDRLVGVPGLKQNSIVGRFHGAFENAYDSFFAGLFNSIALGREGRPRSVGADEFEKMGEKMGAEWQPFSSAEQFAEQFMEVKLPQQLKRHGALLNEVTAALTIRILDFGMAAVNYMSLAATVPPVMKAMNRLPGESTREWMSRNGAWGAMTPEGIPRFDVGRSVVSATRFMFSDEGKGAWAVAKRKGYFDQYAAEQVELFARSGESFLPGLLRNSSNILSKATDWSEIQARAISYMSFYQVGKKSLAMTDDAAATFAHHQANKVIGDFRPTNRPYIFQGATGMPLGLFTTFMWNYMQRTFHMVENRQIGALMTQMGIQSTLFGAESVPLWEEYVTAFGSSWDGDHNIVDRMNSALGHDVTSVMLNGTIGSMLGTSIGPRAAVGLPAQITNPGLDSVPGLRLLSRGAKAAGDAIDSVAREGGINPSRMAEIMAVGNFNKALSNIIEVSQGYALDTRNNIIEEDTRSAIGVSSRLLGFKPLMSDEVRQEARRQSVTTRIRNERKRELSTSLRTLARQGKLTGDAVEFALEQYIEAGGSAEQFKRYFNAQVVKGTTSKLDMDIAEALKDSYDQRRLGRLLFLMDD